ncbi:hypothetical protein [Polaromonas sp.]|nr:hypothetical protein [Polaromonas sp.]MDI1274208.1 hypothetical protein [Polaromonas sp.]
MTDYFIPPALLSALILGCAWREWLADQKRDAKPMAAFGAGLLALGPAAD